MKPRPLIGDHRTAVMVGIGLTVAGAYVLYDAHERAGKHRPFWLRLFGGWV
ncbi:MAG: hypothetical protein JWL97_3809 [Gemmatimonadales bacterium]|nr:hypothetical protein [Gemmatimonadales bacterium]